MIHEHLRLYFSDTGVLHLARTMLTLHGEQVRQVVAFASDLATSPGVARFHWRVGMQVLCLAWLRIKLYGCTSQAVLLLEGGKGSAASTLDNLCCKAGTSKWLAGMLGAGGATDAQTRLLRWFERQNSQLNKPGAPVRVFTRPSHASLVAKNIEVLIGNRQATSLEIRGIERQIVHLLGERERR